MVADANISSIKSDVKAYKYTEKFINKHQTQPIHARLFCIQRILSYFLGLVSGKYTWEKLSDIRPKNEFTNNPFQQFANCVQQQNIQKESY